MRCQKIRRKGRRTAEIGDGTGGGSGVYKGDIGATYPPLESLG